MSRSTRFAELRADLVHAWRVATQAARLAIGLPDYDAYCAHLRERHPGVKPMSRERFAVACMDARYRRGASRCC